MFYVTMTDKFMSGWGYAAGKTNKMIVACDTIAQAEQIERVAQRRVAPQGVAEDERRLRGRHRVERVEDALLEALRVERRRRVREAVARQVGHHDGGVRHQRGHHLGPGVGRSPRPVQQQHRRAVASHLHVPVERADAQRAAPRAVRPVASQA